MEFFITDPTQPLYNESTLDQILTNCKKIKASGTIDTNISDHVPIFINIKKLKKLTKKQLLLAGPTEPLIKNVLLHSFETQDLMIYL